MGFMIIYRGDGNRVMLANIPDTDSNGQHYWLFPIATVNMGIGTPVELFADSVELMPKGTRRSD